MSSLERDREDACGAQRTRRTVVRRALGLAAVGSSVLSIAAGRLPQSVATAPVPPPLVFDGVTVVDVEHGRLVPGQRVVIVGNRIRAMGRMRMVRVPAGARVVDAHGKYLIPGLWDMHTHSADATDVFYPLFLANGVTGIRDAGSAVPLDTLRRWRREILAGTRVGPPRQLLSGQSISGPIHGCDRGSPRWKTLLQTCVADSADAVHYVDSLQAAGADMIKPRSVGHTLYFAIAAEARRIGIPFGGHIAEPRLTALVASDSGARIIDHLPEIITGGYLGVTCYLGKKGVVGSTAYVDPDQHFARTMWNPAGAIGTAAQCRAMEAHFRRNGTWFVLGPTLHNTVDSRSIVEHAIKAYQAFSTGTLLHGNWLRDSASVGRRGGALPDASGARRILQGVGLPFLAGSDVVGEGAELDGFAGFALHEELAMYVAMGLTPLEALQTATLNPATMLHGTDSLGTVAPGKLADLVLLDADPLTDITNTTTIRAVVANGRYFDRAALDQLLIEAQAKSKQGQDTTQP